MLLNLVFQTVVLDDDRTIKIVPVGKGKTSSVKHGPRTEIRRNDRKNG